jgi:hypothetical protein
MVALIAMEVFSDASEVLMGTLRFTHPALIYL